MLGWHQSEEQVNVEYDTVVLGRRSTRGFRPEPVPRRVIEEILELATRAPSSMNTQPWHDEERRRDWVLRGFRQFDAPVSIVVTYDKALQGSDIAPFDAGAVTNALVNAAWSRGLGCVVNSQGIMQSPVVREHARIPEDQVIQICVAMGYPDESFPANAVVSRRRPLDEVATFVGFDEE
jgi:nitroreductase